MTANLRRASGSATVGLLAAASIWIGADYRRVIERARARVAAGSRLIATPCGQIEYAESGSGPALLVVHGAGGGFDQGMAIARPWTANHRVIAMSRFGYLRTPVPEHPSAALQADAHACLLDALDVECAPVIAASAGAPSALEFALRHPGRCTALVLLVPGWYPASELAPRSMSPLQSYVLDHALRSDFLFWAVAKLAPSLAMRTVLGTPPEIVAAAAPEDRVRLSEMLQDILPISSRQGGLALEPQLTVSRLSAPFETIDVPTLAISAEDDLYRTYENAKRIAAGIPNARLIGFPTGGHMLVGHAEDTAAAVADFLNEHRGRPRERTRL